MFFIILKSVTVLGLSFISTMFFIGSMDILKGKYKYAPIAKGLAFDLKTKKIINIK